MRGWPLCVSMVKLNQSMYHCFFRQIFAYLYTIEVPLGLFNFFASLRLLFIIFFEVNNTLKKRFIKSQFLSNFSYLRWWDKRCFFNRSSSTFAPSTFAFTFVIAYLWRYKYFFEIYSMIFRQIIRLKITKPPLISIKLKFLIVIISREHFIHI